MALGIIEKSNNGLFENEIEFNGNYATMVRYLKETVGVLALRSTMPFFLTVAATLNIK